ncbi:MAG TPA: hypothetical protein VH063_10325 [Gaiellaceae bacterium]|jgi:hypothetical protein|nr:hypothetical protein [Gaiellaceae bacterium]
MRPVLVRRQLVLVAVTVLAIAVSLAVTTRPGHKAAAALPPPVGSYTALVASTGPKSVGKKTACGVVVTSRTVGISSPVLPCGVRLYMSRGARHILASVIGRGPTAAGAEFGLTPALAHRLEITGLRRVHWSYTATG